MPEIIRTRERRYRDDYDSDDDRSTTYVRRGDRGGGEGYTSVQRYSVRGGRVTDDFDDTRSVRSTRIDKGPGRSSHLEVDRVERVERIERPRSAFETGGVYRDAYREPERERETSRTIEYVRDRPREYEREPLSARPWERERDRPWERERDVDVSVERRIEKRTAREEPLELERVTREVEYYDRPDPSPQPIVLRQRAPEPQQIIVESAPVPAPIIVQREKYIDNREVVVPSPRQQQQEDYYYRREVTEGAPRRDDRRDEVALYGRRRSDDYSDDDRSEVFVRKERRTVSSRSRSRSHSPHHKLHLAEGALAGAGAAALLANHKDSDHRGRKALGGAALGALGAEVITRARSQYRDRSRHRSRSSSRGGNHTKLKTGLALAATALAAAAAGKYISNRNESKREELARGRSRTRSRGRRYSSSDEYEKLERSRSKHADPKHKAATMAKAGAAAAAVAGLVERARSKSRGGRSKSRLRTGGAIAATGLAGAALANLYENRKAKQDEAELEKVERRRSRSRSSRHRDRSLVYSDPGVDPELGMVQYGADPVYTQHTTTYTEEPRRSRHRDGSADSRSRSRSRVRDFAGGALATGAAAIGINKYQKRKERKEREEAERERRREDPQYSRSRSRSRSRSAIRKSLSQRLSGYEEDASADPYYTNDSYDDGYSPSPPRASGGAYYPETNNFPPPPPPPAGGYTQPPNTAPPVDPHVQYPPYNPADYVPPQQQPNQPGYPAPRDAREGGNVSSRAHYSPSTPHAPLSQPRSMFGTEEDRLRSPRTISSSSGTVSPLEELPPNKSVSFAPLSPKSSKRLARRRRNSDPSSDRPISPNVHRRRHHNASRSPSPEASDSEVEVLPDRFDRDGKPIDGLSNTETEMVERLVHEFGDVLDGRQSWKSLLKGFLAEAAASREHESGRRR